MFFIKVKAKVLRIEEEQIGKNYREFEEQDQNYVWGPMSIRVEDIDKLWGQSLNRSVIALYSGETVLVAESHESLHIRVEALMQERDDAGKDISNDLGNQDDMDEEEDDE